MSDAVDALPTRKRPVAGTSWSFSLRSGYHTDDSDANSDTASSPSDCKGRSPKMKVPRLTTKPSDDDLARSLDLSSRDDTAKFTNNPWAIARLNAAARGNKRTIETPKARCSTPSVETHIPSKKSPSLAQKFVSAMNPSRLASALRIPEVELPPSAHPDARTRSVTPYKHLNTSGATPLLGSRTSSKTPAKKDSSKRKESSLSLPAHVAVPHDSASQNASTHPKLQSMEQSLLNYDALASTTSFGEEISFDSSLIQPANVFTGYESVDVDDSKANAFFISDPQCIEFHIMPNVSSSPSFEDSFVPLQHASNDIDACTIITPPRLPLSVLPASSSGRSTNRTFAPSTPNTYNVSSNPFSNNHIRRSLPPLDEELEPSYNTLVTPSRAETSSPCHELTTRKSLSFLSTTPNRKLAAPSTTPLFEYNSRSSSRQPLSSSKPPAIRHVDLSDSDDEDEWSTLPSRSNRRRPVKSSSKIVASGKFKLPLAPHILQKGDAQPDATIALPKAKVIMYKPPPLKQIPEEDQDENKETLRKLRVSRVRQSY